MKRGTRDAMFKALVDAGFSQREVARLAQVNQSTVCRGIRREFGGQLSLALDDMTRTGLGVTKGGRHVPIEQVRLPFDTPPTHSSAMYAISHA